MTNIVKSPRLKAIVDFVESRVVADVGTDHGKVVAQLFAEGKIDFAYLSDISPKSLDKAKSLLQKLGYIEKSKFLVCNGLENYPKLVLCDVIIAGMGGEEIINILKSSKVNNNVNNYILQPQKNVAKVRQYLVDNGYKIVSDIVVEDASQFYFVLKAKQGKDKLNELELNFGRTNLEDFSADFCKYIVMQKKLYDEIISNANSLTIEKEKYYKLLNEVIKRGNIC